MSWTDRTRQELPRNARDDSYTLIVAISTRFNFYKKFENEKIKNKQINDTQLGGNSFGFRGCSKSTDSDLLGLSFRPPA